MPFLFRSIFKHRIYLTISPQNVFHFLWSVPNAKIQKWSHRISKENSHIRYWKMFGKFSIRGVAGPLLVSSAPPKSGNQFPRNDAKLKLNLVDGLANKATTKQSPGMNAQTKTLSRVATVDLIRALRRRAIHSLGLHLIPTCARQEITVSRAGCFRKKMQI